MAVTHETGLRNDICTAVIDEIDVGAGPGYIELLTALDAECATLVFSDPCGTRSSGILTFDPVNDDASATGGIVTKFKISNSLNVGLLFGTVALTGGDLTISNSTINPGDTVSLSNFFYTAPL